MRTQKKYQFSYILPSSHLRRRMKHDHDFVGLCFIFHQKAIAFPQQKVELKGQSQMQRESSKLRGRIVISIIILLWFIVTIIFGFVINKPTSLAGLTMIVIFLIFILAICVQFLYTRYKKRNQQPSLSSKAQRWLKIRDFKIFCVGSR